MSIYQPISNYLLAAIFSASKREASIVSTHRTSNDVFQLPSSAFNGEADVPVDRGCRERGCQRGRLWTSRQAQRGDDGHRYRAPGKPSLVGSDVFGCHIGDEIAHLLTLQVRRAGQGKSLDQD